jgi:hypothetical protein
MKRFYDLEIRMVSFTETCVVAGTPATLSGIAVLNTAKSALSPAAATPDKTGGALFVGTGPQ